MTVARLPSLALLVGAVALAAVASGGAAAAAGNVSVTPDPVNGSTPVTVNATAGTPGSDLTFAVDADENGTVEASEALGTTTTNASTGNGSVSTALGPVVPGGGTYAVYAVEEGTADGADDTAYPVAASSFDAATTVVVDDAAPTIAGFAVENPGERDVRVSFNASERLADVRVAVTGPDAGTLTEVDFVATGAGPFTYEATYFPAVDGEYAVTVERAADAAGNDGAGGGTASVLAAVAGRNAGAVFASTSPAFLGETDLDVSPVVGDGTATFEPVGSAAGAGPVRADASALDVTPAAGFVPGAYDATGDGEPDLLVRRPTVEDVSLVLDAGPGDVDVAGAYLQAGDAVTVRASFGFGAAADLDVSVVDPAGVDVAPALADDAVLSSEGDAVRLETARDLRPGTYVVTVVADGLDANATASFELVDRDLTVSVDRTRVVRGRDVTATAFGPPGGTAVVRVPTAHLANESTAATDVFERTGDVANRSGSPGHVGAEVVLGRDGIGQVRFDAGDLAAGRARVEAVEGSIVRLDAAAADAVPLVVARRRVVVGDAPDAVPTGETFTVAGRAPQVEAVKAYARIDGAWRPLGDARWTRTAVEADGTFELAVPVSGALAYPGTYPVAVVGVPASSDPDFRDDAARSSGWIADRPGDVVTVRTGVGEVATEASP